MKYLQIKDIINMEFANGNKFSWLKFKIEYIHNRNNWK